MANAVRNLANAMPCQRVCMKETTCTYHQTREYARQKYKQMKKMGGGETERKSDEGRRKQKRKKKKSEHEKICMRQKRKQGTAKIGIETKLENDVARTNDMKKSRHYETDLIFELSSAGGGAVVGTHVFRLRLPLAAAVEQYASRNGAKARRHGEKVGTHIKLLV